MKHAILMSVLVLAAASHASNVTLGENAMRGSASSDGNVAIGNRALMNTKGVRGTVAIGADELSGADYNSDTTSINGEQLWISQPADAFCISPQKRGDFTNAPIWYKQGELRLNAKRVTGASGMEIGHSFTDNDTTVALADDFLYLETYDGDYYSTVHVNVKSLRFDCHFRDVGNARIVFSFVLDGEISHVESQTGIQQRHFIQDRRFSVEVGAAVDEDGRRCITGGDWQVQISDWGWPYEKVNVRSDGVQSLDDFEIKFSVVFDPSYGEFVYRQKTISGLSDRRTQVFKSVGSAGDTVYEGATNLFVTSAGIFDFVNRRTGGMAFKMEDGAFNVYSNGVKVGTLSFTPSN